MKEEEAKSARLLAETHTSGEIQEEEETAGVRSTQVLSSSRGQRQSLQWPTQGSDWAVCLLDHLGRRCPAPFVSKGLRTPLLPASSGSGGQIRSGK